MTEINGPNNNREILPNNESHKTLYRPALIVVTGAPLAGKTSLLERLTKKTNLTGFDVDQERFSNPTTPRVTLPREEERQAVESTYQRVFSQAKDAVAQGNPVIISGVFSRSYYHNLARDFAETSHIPLRIIEIDSPSLDEIQLRLHQRLQDPHSSSNVDTVEKVQEVRTRIQPFMEDTKLVLPCTADPSQQTALVTSYLRDLELEAS